MTTNVGTCDMRLQDMWCSRGIATAAIAREHLAEPVRQRYLYQNLP